MLIPRGWLSGACVLTALALATPAFATVTFLDTGNSPSYSIGFEFKADAQVNSNPNICASCGNPGQAIDFEINVGPTETVAYYGVILNNSFVYNPAIQGTITSIDTTADKNFAVNQALNFNNNYRLVIKQDGLFYAAIIPGTPLIGPGSTGFLPFSASGLLASAFQEVDPTTGQVVAGNPNFSGDPMTFGVAQSVGAAGIPNTAISAVYDNVFIRANTAVPEPGTIALLGTGLLALVARRRKA